MNEDRLRDMYDHITTHNDAASPYYDGPIIGEDCCEHGVSYEDECEDCLPWCAVCENVKVETEGAKCDDCTREEQETEI